MQHRTLAAAALLALAACSPSRTGPSAPGPAPVAEVVPDTLDAGPELEKEDLRTAGRDLLGNVRYDLPMEANTWVATELEWLVGQRKAVVGRWLERAELYQDYVKRVFAAHGLPTDLHHLAMVESGYLPKARSHAGAVGMWQFMPATGRQMGLRIDSLVDERMDPVRSTDAAARHLKELNRAFGGDWSLAAAAYNAGQGRISRGMQGVRARNFWELAVWGDLAQETRQYVPRLYAVTIIARDRTRFGFPASSGLARAFAYDSVRTDLATPLSELATIANVPESVLAELNPHLHRGTTPAGNYWLWVPEGMGRAVQQAYLDSEFRKQGGYGWYAVREGDTVEKLATLAGMEAERFRQLNPRTNLDRLAAGARLRLPQKAAQALSSRPVERVARNDDRSTRAKKPTDDEKGKGDRSEAAKESGRKESGRKESSGTGEKKSGRDEAKRERDAALAEHVVKAGESLWGIARRYGVTVDDVQKANSLSAGTIIPGQTLRIPKEGVKLARADEDEKPAKRETPRVESAKKDEKKEPEKKDTARKSDASKRDEKKSDTSKREETKGGEKKPAGKKDEDASPKKKPAGRYAEYVVKPGDTLWSLARKHDTTVDDLREANRMGEKDTIRPGQKLRVPRADR